MRRIAHLARAHEREVLAGITQDVHDNVGTDVHVHAYVNGFHPCPLCPGRDHGDNLACEGWHCQLVAEVIAMRDPSKGYPAVLTKFCRWHATWMFDGAIREGRWRLWNVTDEDNLEA